MLRTSILRSKAKRLFELPSPSALDSFAATCSRHATAGQYPLASAIEKNVPIYNLQPWASLDPSQRSDLQEEWYTVLAEGPGVFVTKNLFDDHALIDKVTSVFYQIIEEERTSMTNHGDHFAAAGKNDRIWNSFSKHCMTDPASFAAYYANPYLSLISSAWLGPGYRITAQANNVKPGGAAQVCHRDYHLGFMTRERSSQFPQGMHLASQYLTLQGAVAHVDVPLESGPTRLLPFSQTYESGYLAYQLEEFDDYFFKNHVALPLGKGDGIFFNPALFHAAGNNQSTDINRMVNLLQVSSAFGKPMESIDTLPLVERCWDHLLGLFKADGLSDEAQALIAAVGQGYPFPTNLDKNSPKEGQIAPDSEQDIMTDAICRMTKKDEILQILKDNASSMRN